MRRLALVLLAAAVGAPLLAAQDQDPHNEIRELMNEGVELYKRGRKAEAYETFEKAIQKMPRAAEVFAWLKRTGEEIIFGMLNDDDRRIQDLGRRLLELSKPGGTFKPVAAEIKKNIDLLASKEWDVQQAAMFHLVHFGPYAVKYLVPILNNSAEDRLRARVMLALRLIGTEATLGVVEALNGERDEFKLMRQEACIVLGNIGDERAVPALKALHEDPNEYPEVKREAAIALFKLTGKASHTEWKKATDYYYELAQKYYYGHPDVIRGWERSFLFWKWDEENKVLTERRVPQFAYNEQLAEEALFDLLAIDPNYEPAWALLMMTYAAQVIEAESSIHAAEEAKDLEEIKEEEVVAMKGLLGAFERLNVLAEMVGVKYVYMGVERAMKDGTPLVARTLIDVAREKGKPENLPPPVDTGVTAAERRRAEEVGEQPAKEQFIGYPLVDALTYFDKRVRYAAAEAILHIAPRERRLGWELVIPNLSDALGESGVRVVLVIYDVKTEDDYKVINKLRRTLEQVNVFPVIAKSAGEGLIRARDFPTEDLILIQYKVANMLYVREAVDPGKKLVEESVFDALRTDVRTKHVPKYIIADVEEEKTKAEEIYQSHIQAVVMADIDHILMEKHLNETLSFERATRDAKARADNLALRSAVALSKLAVDTTIFPYRDAVPSLIKACSPEVRRIAPIRLASIVALGHFGDTRAVPVLVKIVDDKQGADMEKEIRVAAAKALSQIFWRNKYTPSEDDIQTLAKWLDDGDYDVELAVGNALGNANLVNERRLALEVLKRKSSFRWRLGDTKEEIEKKDNE